MKPQPIQGDSFHALIVELTTYSLSLDESARALLKVAKGKVIKSLRLKLNIAANKVRRDITHK